MLAGTICRSSCCCLCTGSLCFAILSSTSSAPTFMTLYDLTCAEQSSKEVARSASTFDVKHASSPPSQVKLARAGARSRLGFLARRGISPDLCSKSYQAQKAVLHVAALVYVLARTVVPFASAHSQRQIRDDDLPNACRTKRKGGCPAFATGLTSDVMHRHGQS